MHHPVYFDGADPPAHLRIAVVGEGERRAYRFSCKGGHAFDASTVPSRTDVMRVEAFARKHRGCKGSR
jgi:hypothetical protein